MLLPHAGNLDDVRSKAIDTISTRRLQGGKWLLVFLAAIGIGLTSAVAKAGQSVSIDRNQAVRPEDDATNWRLPLGPSDASRAPDDRNLWSVGIEKPAD